MNNLYGLFNQNNNAGFMARFNEFRKNFTGNPQEIIQNMLKSGRVTQAQYNNAVQMANEIMRNFK